MVASGSERAESVIASSKAGVVADEKPKTERRLLGEEGTAAMMVSIGCNVVRLMPPKVLARLIVLVSMARASDNDSGPKINPSALFFESSSSAADFLRIALVVGGRVEPRRASILVRADGDVSISRPPWRRAARSDSEKTS